MRLSIIFLFISFISNAQALVSQAINANVLVKSVMKMELKKNNTIDFKFDTIEELEQGIIKNNAFDFKLKSNSNWILMVSSLTANFLPAGPDSDGEAPASIVSFRTDKKTNFVSLSQNPKELLSGNRGSFTQGNNTAKLDVKVTPGLENSGGLYSIVVVFTLSPQ